MSYIRQYVWTNGPHIVSRRRFRVDAYAAGGETGQAGGEDGQCRHQAEEGDGRGGQKTVAGACLTRGANSGTVETPLRRSHVSR